jgi:hypothetical protein
VVLDQFGTTCVTKPLPLPGEHGLGEHSAMKHAARNNLKATHLFRAPLVAVFGVLPAHLPPNRKGADTDR